MTKRKPPVVSREPASDIVAPSVRKMAEATNNTRKTRFDNIPVACADCPKCGKENVVARVASARSGFNSSTERQITCKQCHADFTVPEHALQIRRHPREEVEAEYGLTTLPWIE